MVTHKPQVESQAIEGLEENISTGGWCMVLQALLQILGSYIGLLLGNYGSEDFSVTHKLVRPRETRLHSDKQKHESLKLMFKCDARSFPESDLLLLKLCGQTCHMD